MFKKPLGNLKTSAPLRSSDRRKLKQRVVDAFQISPEEGDLLVPDGIMSIKFNTHLREPGTAYLAPGGDPLWFTIGKGSEDLIPTIYTLWKLPNLLPFLSTPSSVIPKLSGGADLMIPGVVHSNPSLLENQLVAIRQYNFERENPTITVPLAVGMMAVSGRVLQSERETKGKAVLVYHAWKDHLWTMGSAPDPPEAQTFASLSEQAVKGLSEILEDQTHITDAGDTNAEVGQGNIPSADSEQAATDEAKPKKAEYTPAQISELLHLSLLQATSTTLPNVRFPISATQLYRGYILPARPAFPQYIIPLHESPDDNTPPEVPEQEISIKTSSHKSLTAFLKAAEKASLVTLKSPQKHSQQTDMLIISVNTSHSLVAAHKKHVTIKDIEEKAAKKAQREEQAASTTASDILIRELYKPHLGSVQLFKDMGASPSELYTGQQVRSLLVAYFQSHNLVNPNDQTYINLDDSLRICFVTKVQGKGKAKGGDDSEELNLEFMKREELIKRVIGKMQEWYEVSVADKDRIRKKGALQPIQVVMKMRQGRKASTLITGFEPFQVVNAEDMAEDLRKICAGATSVSPVPGKPAGSGSEVFVQGKQYQAVADYLQEKGIPKKWIEVRDEIGKKR